MGKVILVVNGVFPITKDIHGNKVETDTGYKIPGTIQGEGLLAGVPSIFIRFAGCNLRCSWKLPDGRIDICDTPYASHNVKETVEWDIDDVVKVVVGNCNNIRHVVITGGEPTLQKDSLAELAQKLKMEAFHITLETNGTNFDANFAKHIDLFSISPKLTSANPTMAAIAGTEDKTFGKHALRRYALASLEQYLYFANQPFLHRKEIQLKFVVTNPAEEKEIRETYLLPLSVEDNVGIYVMPVGSTDELLAISSRNAAEIAIRNGWRFSPRLQVPLFGNKAGT